MCKLIKFIYNSRFFSDFSVFSNFGQGEGTLVMSQVQTVLWTLANEILLIVGDYLNANRTNI